MDAGDGLTAEQLRARIEEQRALQATLTAQGEDALREIGEAEERQRLRRQLDVEETRSSHLGAVLYSRQRRRRSIDRDEAGALPSEESTFAKPKPQPTPGALAKTTTSYASNVVKRDFVWEVSGLSWLEQQLAQEGRECTSSDIFHVHPNDSDSKYVLVYSPRGASLLHADANVCDESSDWDIYKFRDFLFFDENLRGTLALVRGADSFGTNLCYRFFVRDARGDFRPWGEARRVAVPARDHVACFVGGPDLETEAKGLFGLTFEELLGSEWVVDDSITFKVEIEESVVFSHPSAVPQIRLGKADVTFEQKTPSVEVPPSTLQADLLSLLIEGRHSDVSIEAVYGEAAPVTFSAHTNILSQRSDVFAAAFSHEMRESATRTLTVTDVPPPALKALLHFLYTDDFDEVLKVLREEATHAAGTDAGDAASSSAGSSSAAPISCAPEDAQQSIAQLQAVLAAAHKYGVLRLLRWAEGQLCDKLSCEMACSLLSLAHVYGATELERNCLAFMKANMANVVKRAEFAALPPEALVKFNMHCAGIEPSEEEPGRKRKRDDE